MLKYKIVIFFSSDIKELFFFPSGAHFPYKYLSFPAAPQLDSSCVGEFIYDCENKIGILSLLKAKRK